MTCVSNAYNTMEDCPCVIVVGNPGVGKSALCNAFGAKFESGVSLGTGLTIKKQTTDTIIQGKKLTLVDVPGLYEGDPELTKQNGKEIKAALGLNRKYKILFVTTLPAGRCVAQDISMMKAVMEAIETTEDQIAVVINKVEDDVFEEIEKPGGMEIIAKLIKSGGVMYDGKRMAIIEKLNMNTDESKNKIRAKLNEILFELIPRNIKVVNDISLTEIEVNKMQEKINLLERQNNEMTKQHYKTQMTIDISNLKNEAEQLQTLIELNDAIINEIREQINNTKTERGVGFISASAVGGFFAPFTFGASLAVPLLAGAGILASNKNEKRIKEITHHINENKILFEKFKQIQNSIRQKQYS